MSLSKKEFLPFSKDLENLFENILKSRADSSFIDTGTWQPSVDIKEENDKFLVTADIPGVDEKDINISLDNNLLTIHGERKIEHSENKEGYSRIERVHGQFYRRFSLPQVVDDNKIDATYKHGVLTVIIPKKEIKQGKKIEVRSI